MCLFGSICTYTCVVFMSVSPRCSSALPYGRCILYIEYTESLSVSFVPSVPLQELFMTIILGWTERIRVEISHSLREIL